MTRANADAGRGGWRSEHTGSALREELLRLLAEDPDEAGRRTARAADEMCGGLPLVLHGCGQMGRTLARVLAAAGRPALGFSDNDEAKWGTTVEGLDVWSPADAISRHGESAAFVVSKWSPGDGYLDVEGQLRALGARTVVPLAVFFWRYPEQMMPYYHCTLPRDVLAHRDEIVRVYDLLADDESRIQYLGQVAWRLTLDYTALTPPEKANTYFVPDIVRLSDHEVFVDCGAFDGDTVHAFLRACGGEFASVHAFEPDAASFADLSASLEGLDPAVRRRIFLRAEATGSEACTLRFEASGGTDAKVSDAGDVEVPCVRLDDVLEHATYIKMDIEGAEVDTLLGARRIIESDHPRLAASLYHTPEDFYRIPLLINRLDPSAELYCRAHCVDGIDFVVYAVHG
jgi:FkbM family methyltransferase